MLILCINTSQSLVTTPVTLSHVTVQTMRYKKTEWKFKSHHIQKRFFMQFSTNGCDVSAGKNNRKCHSIHLCRYSLRFVTKTSMRQPVAKVLETLPYFGSNGLSMIFCL